MAGPSALAPGVPRVPDKVWTVPGSDAITRARITGASQDDASIGNGEPCPRQPANAEARPATDDFLPYPPTLAELLTNARLCWQAGLTAIPVRRTASKKGVPQIKWVKGGWRSRVLDGVRIPWVEVEQTITSKAQRTNGLAIIIPRWLVIADPDSPEAAEYAEEQGLPQTVGVAGTRGVHHWYRHAVPYVGRHHVPDLDPDADPRAGKLELLGPGTLAFIPPSFQKRWLGHPSDPIADAPAWMVALMRRQSESRARETRSPAERAGRAPRGQVPRVRVGNGDYDIAEWQKYIPSLEPAGDEQWLGFCPWHEDPPAGHSRSFGVFRGRDGRLRGQCFAPGCNDSAIATPLAAGGRRLRRVLTFRQFLWKMTNPLDRRVALSPWYGRAFEALNALDLPDDERTFWEGLLRHATRNGYDPRHLIAWTTRDIVGATRCEKVVWANPDGRPRSHLSNHGRSVVRLIGRVVARFPGDEQEARWVPGTGRGVASLFLIPQAWIAPRGVQMSGDLAAGVIVEIRDAT